MSSDDFASPSWIGPAAQSAVNANIMTGNVGDWLDIRGFTQLSVTIVGGAGIASGQITFEGTNDLTLQPSGQVLNTIYEVGADNSQTFAALSIAASTIRTFIVPAVMNYFRVRISTVFAGGSIQGIVIPRRIANPMPPAMTQRVGGPAASGAAISNAPVRIGGRAQNTNYSTLSNDQTADLITTLWGALVVKQYSIPELEWSYFPPVGGLLNTVTAVTVKAAAGAGKVNYITSMQLFAEALGAATEFAIRDGAAGPVLWKTKIPATGQPLASITFPDPIRGSNNTLTEIVTLTASVTGAVYCNLQGYSAT